MATFAPAAKIFSSNFVTLVAWSGDLPNTTASAAAGAVPPTVTVTVADEALAPALS